MFREFHQDAPDPWGVQKVCAKNVCAHFLLPNPDSFAIASEFCRKLPFAMNFRCAPNVAAPDVAGAKSLEVRIWTPQRRKKQKKPEFQIWTLKGNREVLHGVGADGVGVKFPHFYSKLQSLALVL